MRVAAIDIGSNFIRLLVGEVTDEQDGGEARDHRPGREALRGWRGVSTAAVGSLPMSASGRRRSRPSSPDGQAHRRAARRDRGDGGTRARPENGAAVAESIGAESGCRFASCR